jgi:transcriptional regulator NrdR family protein
VKVSRVVNVKRYRSGAHCPTCHSSKTIRYGTFRLKEAGLRYRRKCKNCGRFYTYIQMRFQKLYSRKPNKVLKFFRKTVDRMILNHMPISKRRVTDELRKLRIKINDSTANEWLHIFYPNIQRATSRPGRAKL